MQKTGIYNDIRGEDGLELNDKYADGMRTVFGIHSSGYPNLFIMGGYQASFQFNLTFMLQTQGRAHRRVHQVCPRPRPHDDRRRRRRPSSGGWTK